MLVLMPGGGDRDESLHYGDTKNNSMMVCRWCLTLSCSSGHAFLHGDPARRKLIRFLRENSRGGYPSRKHNALTGVSLERNRVLSTVE